MMPTFHLSMTWLHRWSGLLFGWLLYVIALTGTIVVFSDELTAWMQPELPATTVPTVAAVATAERHLRIVAPRAESWSIIPSAEHGAVTVYWAGTESGKAVLDARTGHSLTPRDTKGAEPLVALHFALHSGTVGMWIVAACGMIMLVGLLTGIVIHRRIFRDFFVFRLGKGQRSWLDAHNVAGVTTLPFQIVIAFTGLMIFPVLLMPGALAMRYGGDRAAYVADWYAPTERAASGREAALIPLAPLVSRASGILAGEPVQIAIANPGDEAAVVTLFRATDDRLSMMADWAAFSGADGRLLGSQTAYPPGVDVSGFMVGLHFAKFGGGWTRWLYFLSGLASTALMATGLILWTIKRRARVPADDCGLGMVEWLNLSVVGGLPVAIAVFLSANRLLPASLAGRGDWEVATLFASWAICATAAIFRRGAASWAAMLTVTAVLLGATVAGELFKMSAPASPTILPMLILCAIAAALAAWLIGRRTAP